MSNAAILRVGRSGLGATWRDWESIILACYIKDEVAVRTPDIFDTSTMDIQLLVPRLLRKEREKEKQESGNNGGKQNQKRNLRLSIQVKAVTQQTGY